MSTRKQLRTLPCDRRKYASAQEAQAGIEEMAAKGKDVTRLVAYRCVECSSIGNIWHCGLVGLKGKVNVRLGNGRHERQLVSQLVRRGDTKL